MKKLANVLIVVGIGVLSLLVIYSLKVSKLTEIEASIILFFTGILVITGLLMKIIINRKVMSKDKLYSRLIIVIIYFTIITYNLIRILI